VNHPRISDMAFQLVSPDNKRVLVFENRGGTNMSGIGADVSAPAVTNILATVLDNGFEDFPATYDIPAGTDFIGWHVDAGNVDVVSGVNGSGFYGNSM
jgi:hypothetical protein